MAALDFADNAPLQYEHATRYLICHEEEHLKVANKEIEMLQDLECETSAPYFKACHHSFMAT
jgi:hypothetical protein